MIKQESTYNKETGQLTSFTEYLNGELQYYHVYDDKERIIEYKDNIYSFTRKLNENGEILEYQDTLGGFEKLFDTNKKRLHVECSPYFGTFSNSIYLHKALHDNLTHYSGTKFHKLEISLKDNLNRHLLSVIAYKPQGFSDFYLSNYIENHFFDAYTKQLSIVTHPKKLPNLENYICLHRITPLDNSEPQETKLGLREFPTRITYLDILKNYGVKYAHTGMPLY